MLVQLYAAGLLLRVLDFLFRLAIFGFFYKVLAF